MQKAAWIPALIAVICIPLGLSACSPSINKLAANSKEASWQESDLQRNYLKGVRNSIDNMAAIGLPLPNSESASERLLTDRAAEGRVEFGEDKLGPFQLLQFRFVHADEMSELAKSVLGPQASIRVDKGSNSLQLRGEVGSDQLNDLSALIDLFDTPTMREKRFALIGVDTIEAEQISTRALNKLGKHGDVSNSNLSTRLFPNSRLGAILVVADSDKHLTSAIRAVESEKKSVSGKSDLIAPDVLVYRPKFRKADELVAVIKKFGNGSTNSFSSSSEGGASVNFTSDNVKGVVLVSGPRNEGNRVLAMLRELDAKAKQVLLEVAVAEVSLRDNMQFGLRWFLGSGGKLGRLSATDLNKGIVPGPFAGLSYFLRANDFGATLEALSEVTEVNVLSTPSILVADGQPANLNVGDEIPVLVESVDSDNNVVSTFQRQPTGIILDVTPQINRDGTIALSITQEVSSAIKTRSSKIDSPTIRKRTLKTVALLSNGEAIALGGLIQQRQTDSVSKTPVLGDVPVLGNLFKQKGRDTGRTELLVFIRGRTVDPVTDSAAILKEFKDELSIRPFKDIQSQPHVAQDLVEVLQ